MRSFKQQPFNQNLRDLKWKWDKVRLTENLKDRLILVTQAVEYTSAKLYNTFETELKDYTR